jgi:serine protease inhibitor
LTGKIQELLPRNSIREQTKLVVVNAIYFKGKWDDYFNETCTTEMPFKINQVGGSLFFFLNHVTLMRKLNGKV